MSSSPGKPPQKRWLLRCNTCHNEIPCVPADIAFFAKTGWPQCCGETMVFCSEEEASGTSESRDLEGPQK
jgi:hypothetical protein